MRKELNDLLRQSKKENPCLEPTHIIIFGNKEDEQFEYAFCFEEQIDHALSILYGKVEFAIVREVGKIVARIQ
ncbi:hypothetical protein TU57_10620 [Bacillus cereus]|uniref:hypothetical protein n=1 Tax=Bacillus cereus group TaxID=86661 RepID=UPI00065B923E|nr:hypothetical protein [Bacillus cereus]KMP65191.1 hypothetical protein TU57_10620 [Bacillus cereus]